MSRRDPLTGLPIAISVSDSPDLSFLGFGEQHLRDAMGEISRHLLVAGAHLFYGGDLRPDGFTELMLELIARHRPEAESNREPAAVSNYLPWPVHMSLTPVEVAKWADGIRPVAKLICLGRNGGVISAKRRAGIDAAQPTADDWFRGLSSMRRVLTKLSSARVIIGGKVEDYRGMMPGIAEEALTSLRAKKPIFIFGGFGGCARDIAETMGLVERHDVGRIVDWTGREAFSSFGARSLNNNLTADENSVLIRTAHIDEAVALMLRGMRRLFDR